MPDATEKLPVVLKYEGPDVDDGTMSIEDIVPVLQGFTAAYTKVAAEQGIAVQHRIRIRGVERGSADILLEVWQLLGQAADSLTSISILGGGAISVIGAIFGYVKLKRHVRNQPYRDAITNQNTITVTNSENVSIEVSVHVYQIFQNRTLDAEVGRMVRPLREGHINAAEFIARPTGSPEIAERVSVEERQYFETTDEAVTNTQETWLTGQLNSLTKSTNSGHIYLNDGRRVFYRYVGDTPMRLHGVFSHSGPVRVRAVAYLDENLAPVRLEISEIEPLQGQLFPRSDETPPGNGVTPNDGHDTPPPLGSRAIRIRDDE